MLSVASDTRVVYRVKDLLSHVLGSGYVCGVWVGACDGDGTVLRVY